MCRAVYLMASGMFILETKLRAGDDLFENDSIIWNVDIFTIPIVLYALYNCSMRNPKKFFFLFHHNVQSTMNFVSNCQACTL